MAGPVEQSEKIRELFRREKIDPGGRKILAFAVLYELGVAPAVWVGPGTDPFAVEGESDEIRTARFFASKIIPGYQPHFIPAHLKVDRDTPVAIRQFRYDESLDAGYINQTLAVMLAELLPDQDLSNCSALSLIGESRALGQTRFAIVVGETQRALDQGKRLDKSPQIHPPKRSISQAPKTAKVGVPPKDLIERWTEEIKVAEDRETNKYLIGCSTIIVGGVGAGLIYWLLRDYRTYGVILGMIGLVLGIVMVVVAYRRDQVASEKLAKKIIKTCESRSLSKTLVVEALWEQKISGEVNKSVLTLIEPKIAEELFAKEPEEEEEERVTEIRGISNAIDTTSTTAEEIDSLVAENLYDRQVESLISGTEDATGRRKSWKRTRSWGGWLFGYGVLVLLTTIFWFFTQNDEVPSIMTGQGIFFLILGGILLLAAKRQSNKINVADKSIREHNMEPVCLACGKPVTHISIDMTGKNVNGVKCKKCNQMYCLGCYNPAKRLLTCEKCGHNELSFLVDGR